MNDAVRAPKLLASAVPPVAAQPAFRPLYAQIKGLLLEGLQHGEWRPGDAIPSEFELASRFRVSQGTVRKAIDELAGENLLVRRQGKGTFVATHVEQRAQYRFLRLAADADAEPDRPASERRFIDCQAQRAPADIARMLGLRSGAAVIEIRRLLSFRGAPVVLDDIWLPGTLFKGLTAARLAAWSGPMYALFEQEFGVHMARADEKIRAVAADAEVAALLAVAPGAPLLSVERLSFTFGDKPVELRRGLYHTAAHHYRNALT